ncbi:unnamed protein product [Cutaneotrichosporon oleaginosum]
MSSPHGGRRPISASAVAAPPDGGNQHQEHSGRPTTLPPGALPSTAATGVAPKAVPAAQDFTRVTRIKRGIFANKYMSFCLQVAQQPVSGRRKTEKDRRPIAPTPIVRLWIREHHDASSPGMLVNPSDIDVSALVCAVDIVEPNSPASPEVRTGRAHRSTRSPSPPRARLSSSSKVGTSLSLGSGSTSASSKEAPVGLGIGGVGGMWQGLSTDDAGGGGGVGSSQAGSSRHGAGLSITPIPRPRSRHSQLSPGSGDHETSSEDDASPVVEPSGVRGSRPSSASRPASGGSEASRGGTRRGRGRSAASGDSTRPGSGRRTAADESTRNLHGRLHIEPNRVIDMEGAMGLWFLFTNLSIRYEGTSATGRDLPPAPYLATCQSKNFKVFSPLNYQGRPPNTPLADHFNRQGFKLNTRKVRFPSSP